MKKYYLLIAAAFLIIFHSLKGFNFLGLLLFIVILLGFLMTMKEITESISRRIEASKETAKQAKHRAKLLYRMSQASSDQIERFFESNQESSEKAKVYRMKPRLGLVHFQEETQKKPQEHDVPYDSDHYLADMKQVEDYLSQLSSQGRKLVFFVSDQRPVLEAELILSLKKNELPHFAIQKEVLLGTDFLEISTEGYIHCRSHLRRLAQSLGTEYQHFVYFYPTQVENVYPFDKKGPAEEDFTQG